MIKISELESIEKEFISIFNIVTGDDLNIEDCRILANKIFFLNSKKDHLFAEWKASIKSQEKKNSIISLFQIAIYIVCLVMCMASPIFFTIAIANLLLMRINITKITQEQTEIDMALEKAQSMIPLMDNCITFLNKKIDLACLTSTFNQGKGEKTVQNLENMKLMAVNDLINLCIYEGIPYLSLETGDNEIAIRILQSDLDTEETDLNKLIAMAREKVQNELNFTRTLHK